MESMKLSDQGKIPFDEKTASLAYKCVTCRASRETCELGNPVPETLLHYRVRAFEKGVSPQSVYRYAKKFQQENNPFGQDLTQKLSRLYPKALKRSSKIVYFPGCTEIRYFPETIDRAFHFFRRLKLAVSLFPEPIQCCGYPLLAAGDFENFREVAEIQIPTLRKYREVISGAPACLYTMETVYRSLGFRFSTKFFHVAEKIPPHPPFAKGGRRGLPQIAYHDPCYLGRYRGVYEQPRQMLAALTGRPVKEFFLHHEKSACCGAGGLLPITSPETAKKITEGRLAEFSQTGAEQLVSACPTCLHRFKKAESRLEVKGLLDFL